MHPNITRLAWPIFAALACSSWYACFFLTSMPHLFDALFGMAVLNFVIGAWIIRNTKRRRRTVLLVGIALLTGHWCALLWGFAFLMWHFRGFAP